MKKKWFVIRKLANLSFEIEIRFIPTKGTTVGEENIYGALADDSRATTWW